MDTYDASRPPPLEEVERRHILNVLKFAQGRKITAAALLGISLKTLYNKLNRYELEGTMETRA